MSGTGGGARGPTKRHALPDSGSGVRAGSGQKHRVAASSPKSQARDVAYSVKVTLLDPASVKQKCKWTLDSVCPSGHSPLTPGSELPNLDLRLYVEDRHGIRGADGSRTGANRGKDFSRLAYLKSVGRGWDRDLMPFVPLRIEVRKASNGEWVDLKASDNVSVVLDLLDPREEKDQYKLFHHMDRAEEYLLRFFGEHKVHKDPVNVEFGACDNAPVEMDGSRPKDAPPPALGTLFKHQANVESSDPPRLSPGKTPHAAKATVAIVEGKGRCDVLLGPKAIGGDNYEIRARIASGDQLQKMVDRNQAPVDSYVSPTITIWRKVVLELLYRPNDGFNPYGTTFWERARQCYRTAFIELVGPVRERTYDEATWKAAARAVLRRKGTGTEAPNTWVWFKWFLPGGDGRACESVPDPGDDWVVAGTNDATDANKSHKLVEKLLGDKLREEGMGLGSGFAMLGIRSVSKRSGLMGAYIWDDKFYFATTGDVLGTFVHELGHALGLDHSWTTTVPKPAPHGHHSGNIDYPEQHDQNDAFQCVMAYGNDHWKPNGVEMEPPLGYWHFCAICNLQLRNFSRRALLQDAWVQQRLKAAFKGPPELHVAYYPNLTGNDLLHERVNPGELTLTLAAVGGLRTRTHGGVEKPFLMLFPLVPSDDRPNNSGPAGFKDACALPGFSSATAWVQSDKSVAEVFQSGSTYGSQTQCVWVKKKVGTATFKFKSSFLGTESASFTLRVTP